MPEQNPCTSLTSILREIETSRPILATAPPEHQRLAMTAWIARARVHDRADGRVRPIACSLQAICRDWWPGSVHALARTTPTHRVFPDTPTPLRTWDAVAREATARRERVPNWADDDARMPSPWAPEAMFAAACTVLTALGGPLGGSEPPAPAAVHEASRRVAELQRVAAELRWLRGAVDPLSWASAIGRLRRLTRMLGRDGEGIAAVLDPGFSPPSWARHLGRDPHREAVLATVPDAGSDATVILTWLLRAFDALDTDGLASLCSPCRTQILGLHPQLASRRHRRRLTALQHRMSGISERVLPEPTAAPRSVSADSSHTAAARTMFTGRRALFVSNRSFPELETRLHAELGLECDAVAAVGSPRRRHALLQRIRGGAYDVVLVAHDFSGHNDTEQIAAACRAVNILYCAVGKGRFTRVVSRLLAAGPARPAPPRAAASRSASMSPRTKPSVWM